MDFGESLELLRGNKEISQNQLGKDLGVSGSSINRYERGDHLPKIDFLIVLSHYFNCSTDVILGLKEEDKSHYSEIAEDCAKMITQLDFTDQIAIFQYLKGYENCESIWRKKISVNSQHLKRVGKG